jgi:hypothetical protein
MANIYDTGGMIGAKLYFETTDSYIIGTTTGLLTPTYVGGQTLNLIGTTANTVTNFSLTGGIDSTPREGDIVIIAVSVAATSNILTTIYPVLGSDGASYTQISATYVNNTANTNDTNAFFGYKIMGATPDTSFRLSAGTGNAANGGAVTLQVWRNISSSSPTEGGTKSSSSTQSALANPPAATINTAGAIVIAVTASAHTGGADTYSSSQLSNFLSASGSDTYDSSVGMGSYSGGAPFDPAVFTFTQADSTAFSSVAYTQTFTPATGSLPVYGNLKNSGIWSLKSSYNSDSIFLDSYTSLLLRGEGVNNGTTFTDSSFNNLTVTGVGNAKTSTTAFKRGTASISFDGTGDYLTAPYSTALDLIGSDFTIEAWVNPAIFKAGGTRIFSTGGGLVGWNSTTGIHILLQLSVSGRIDFQISQGTSTPLSASSDPAASLNTWTHLAVSYIYPNTVITFVNGVPKTTTLGATPVRPSTNPTTAIATIPGEAGGVGTAFSGYIDNLVISKGVARYTTDFTPR